MEGGRHQETCCRADDAKWKADTTASDANRSIQRYGDADLTAEDIELAGVDAVIEAFRGDGEALSRAGGICHSQVFSNGLAFKYFRLDRNP